jgi:hypothetical protein
MESPSKGLNCDMGLFVGIVGIPREKRLLLEDARKPFGLGMVVGV